MRLLLKVPFLLLPSIVSAQVSFHARYNEAGNAFRILDCVSNWSTGYCGDKGAYRKDWEKRLEMDDADRELFKKYGKIRFRYFAEDNQWQEDPLKNKEGFFTSSKVLSEDLLAAAFYDSDTIEDALQRLAGTVSKDDLGFLRIFYSKFHDRLKLYKKESEPFIKAADTLNKKLQNPEYVQFFRTVEQFYGVNANIDYAAIYVWWPPLNSDYAYPVGSSLILAKNPVEHIDWPDEYDVFHEVVHTISARQPAVQKQKLTEAFLKICDIRFKEDSEKILEEPLAVAIGQMLFLKRFDPKLYTEEKNWYEDPWINRFSQAIFPLVEQAFAKNQLLDVDLIEKAAGACKQLQ